MIKTEKGATKCIGSMPELLADYMSITSGLFEALSEQLKNLTETFHT